MYALMTTKRVLLVSNTYIKKTVFSSNKNWLGINETQWGHIRTPGFQVDVYRVSICFSHRRWDSPVSSFLSPHLSHAILSKKKRMMWLPFGNLHTIQKVSKHIFSLRRKKFWASSLEMYIHHHVLVLRGIPLHGYPKTLFIKKL